MYAITEYEAWRQTTKMQSRLLKHIRGRKIFYEENLKTIYRLYN